MWARHATLRFVGAEVVDEQLSRCRTCGHLIVWYFDEGEEPVEPHGFWYDFEHLTEVCGGPDPSIEPDDDLWHEPVGGA